MRDAPLNELTIAPARPNAVALPIAPARTSVGKICAPNAYNGLCTAAVKNPLVASLPSIKTLEQYDFGLANEGMTMMVVTHEMGFARKVSNRVVFIDVGGHILEDCSRDEFFGNPDARRPRTKDFLTKILQH
jgi:hypothetical protein